MIAVKINGKQVQLDGPTPLLAYLEQLGVSPGTVAVEHNGVIIERDAYPSTQLGDGDVVEIVRMVGGGGLNRQPSSPLRRGGPAPAGEGTPS